MTLMGGRTARFSATKSFSVNCSIDCLEGGGVFGKPCISNAVFILWRKTRSIKESELKSWAPAKAHWWPFGQWTGLPQWTVNTLQCDYLFSSSPCDGVSVHEHELAFYLLPSGSCGCKWAIWKPLAVISHSELLKSSELVSTSQLPLRLFYPAVNV